MHEDDKNLNHHSLSEIREVYKTKDEGDFYISSDRVSVLRRDGEWEWVDTHTLYKTGNPASWCLGHFLRFEDAKRAAQMLSESTMV